MFSATIRDANGDVIAAGSDSTVSVSFARSAGSGSVSGSGTSAASGGVVTRQLTGGAPGAVTVVTQVTLKAGWRSVERDRLQRRVRRRRPSPLRRHGDDAARCIRAPRSEHTFPVVFDSPNVGDSGTRVERPHDHDRRGHRQRRRADRVQRRRLPDRAGLTRLPTRSTSRAARLPLRFDRFRVHAHDRDARSAQTRNGKTATVTLTFAGRNSAIGRSAARALRSVSHGVPAKVSVTVAVLQSSWFCGRSSI